MTPAERADLAESMVPVACDLACMVRDGDAEGVGAFLAAFDPAHADALVITLAAMVPVDAPLPGLLSWVPGEDSLAVARGGTPRALRGECRPTGGGGEWLGRLRDRRMREYARLRGAGESIAGAAERLMVSRRTAERYEAALLAAGEAAWREGDRAA